MVSFIHVRLFILTYHYDDSRLLVWARISNYFDGENPLLSCAVWIIQKQK